MLAKLREHTLGWQYTLQNRIKASVTAWDIIQHFTVTFHVLNSSRDLNLASL